MIFGDKLKKIESYAKKGRSAKLIGLLNDKKQDVRLAAIKALGGIGDDTSVNNLIVLMADPDPVIRKQVAVSMGDTGKDVCKTHLQSRVSVEKDEAVLEAVHDSIMRISKEVGYVR
jgi:HEAT repeat protein